jgi:trypsin
VSRTLQEVDYNTVSNADCKAAHYIPVYDTNICAYYPGGGRGSCSVSYHAISKSNK